MDVQVTQPISRGGTFRMLNLSDFVYEPAAGQTGYERIVLEVTGEFRGMQRTLPVVYLATTEEGFRASGGRSDTPPPGFTESPYHRRQLLAR
ncbi:hypothetical protein JNW90_13210 [Micromonospora sp. STR1s_5]|nr:hypothetical protein [Micromonospora sp. STR1s_5]